MLNDIVLACREVAREHQNIHNESLILFNYIPSSELYVFHKKRLMKLIAMLFCGTSFKQVQKPLHYIYQVVQSLYSSQIAPYNPGPQEKEEVSPFL